MKKRIELDEYEKDMLELAESEFPDLQRPTEAEKRQVQEMARQTLTKDKRINIRLSSRDVIALKRKANRYGLPYQTLISSVLHRYASGELKEMAGPKLEEPGGL